MNRVFRLLGATLALVLLIGLGSWREPARSDEPAVAARPHYRIDAAIDYELLTYNGRADITVPVAPGDAPRDVVCFMYPNASGIGGEDTGHKFAVVDAASLVGTGSAAPLSFTLDGAVLRIQLPQPPTGAFTVRIAYHGVVPRGPAEAGGLAEMMGGMTGDLGDVLGGLGGLAGGAAQPAEKPKPKNADYGLYTFGAHVLSLGSFWYPSLAVRQQGKWVDDPPTGLGDVGYSEMSDFDVALKVPPQVRVVCSGEPAGDAPPGTTTYQARNVRDFAVLMSDRYVVKSKTINAGGKEIRVDAFTVAADAARADRVLDIAGHALQDYSRRFGPYIYGSFKVAEGPIRGGAGGMEFSGMTSVAAGLYQDLDKQFSALAGSMGGGDLDKVMQGLGLREDGGVPPTKAPATKAPAAAEPPAPDNPATDMLQGLLGQQKDLFSSLFETTIAHETAHQWWAMAVGSDSQRAPFVDESLTNYSAMLYYEGRYGRAAADKMVDLNLKTTYSMARTLGGADAPANLASAAYKNNLQYGAVVYGKGALYYAALRQLMGDSEFFAGLRNYYARYNSRLASSHALVDCMKEQSPAKSAAIEALFRRWILETHGDEDITGGAPATITDLLGGLLGGAMGGE